MVIYTPGGKERREIEVLARCAKLKVPLFERTLAEFSVVTDFGVAATEFGVVTELDCEANVKR